MNRFALLCFSLAVCLASPVAKAKSQYEGFNPARLDLGSVYVGSIIEGSFSFRVPGTDPNISFEIGLPKFTRIVKKSQQVVSFGKKTDLAKTFVEGVATFSILTEMPGDYRGEFFLTLGKSQAKLPISVTVKAQQPGLTRVLVVHSPFQTGNSPDPDFFRPWTDLASKYQLDVSLLVDNQSPFIFRDLDLTKFDTVLVSGEALVGAKKGDWKSANDFVKKGGRLVLETSNFWTGNVENINLFLEEKGMRVRLDETESRKPLLLAKSHLAPILATNGISSLRFIRVTPIEVTDPSKSHVLVQANSVGEKGDGLIVRTQLGKGEMLVTGQPLWWNWIGPQWAKDSDNAKMLAWMLIAKK